MFVQFSQRGTGFPLRGRTACVNWISFNLRLGLFNNNSLASPNSAQAPNTLPHEVLTPNPPNLSA